MTARNGQPCKKCGGNEWYTNGNCAPCHRESSAKWQRENPEKCKEKGRRWSLAHPEKEREKSAKKRRENPEKAREYVRKWGEKNPEKKRENSEKWKRENPEKVRRGVAKWVRENPDKRRAIAHRRNTRKTKAGGSYTAAEWKALVEHYGGKCLCCGRDDVALTVDHVVPISKGGTSNIDNLQPLCLACNSGKRDKTIDYRPGKGLGRWLQVKLFG